MFKRLDYITALTGAMVMHLSLGTSVVHAVSFHPFTSVQAQVLTQALGINTIHRDSCFLATLDADGPSVPQSLSCRSVGNASNASVPAPPILATAKASVDRITGELKVFFEGLENPPSVPADSMSTIDNRFSMTARAHMNEPFTISGNGTISARLGMDGSFNIPIPIGGFEAYIYIGNGGPCNISARDGPFVIPGVCSETQFSLAYSGPQVGSVDQVLTAALDVVDGQSFVLAADIFSSQLNNPGILDFNSTFELFLTASPGIRITFGDLRFLSNPAFLGVPEPTTVLLLGLGLAGLGFARKRLH